jgi:transketolase
MRNRIVTLIEASAIEDERFAFLTGDLGYSVVEPLQATLGERFINAGVAEANMVSMAGGLAALGFKPFVYSIGPFMTSRCFEQIRNDIVYQQRKVGIIGVGSGFSYGTLGPSHHALEDAHIMSALPGLIVLNPANIAELDRVYALAQNETKSAYFRIARESGVSFSAPIFSLDNAAYKLREGGDVTLIASGVTVSECLAAAERLESRGIYASVISVPVLSPFPVDRVSELVGGAPVISVFEGYRGNPLSQGVMQALLRQGGRVAYRDLCAPHAFAHIVGNTTFLRRQAGLDALSIAASAHELTASESRQQRRQK